MPPKNTKKAAPAPETPVKKHGSEKEDVSEEDEEASVPTPTPAKASKPRTPRKKKEPEKLFKKLGTSTEITPAIDVGFENDTVHSKALPVGGYGQVIQLTAPRPFELVTSIMTQDGYQAIIIKPAKPFAFLKLPKSVRAEIYRLLFQPGNVNGNGNGKTKIEISSTAGGVIAKDYAKEIKHRLAIIQVNKEICDAARPIMYGRRLSFDNSTTLLSFLTLSSDVTRSCLTNINMKAYQRSVSTSLMSLLCTCTSLEKIVFGSNVGEKCLPNKAARTFFAEVGRLLQALVVRKGGDVEAAFDVLQFGPKCLSIKEDEELRSWDEDEIEEFAEAMKSKLIAQRLPSWTCLCGSTIYGHNCHETMIRASSQLSSIPSTSQATNGQPSDSGVLFHGGSDSVTESALKGAIVRAAEKAVAGMKTKNAGWRRVTK